ncbi:hypothetical protein J8F10_20420 [Gemmata sp. G18]|uniref:ABC-type uncharacterized transport system domain-containing protein n=1 Tax=Gemmata palustris TaxID=2822762 RepID=A0ABS5BV83_9BACT|nr:hypothetical protein [Gemmata palustris]MBP3957621.1 hypothetical protein [Gemmata palustris]
MATDSRQRTTWGSRFRFLIRALGATGFMAVVVGLPLASVSLPRVDLVSWSGWRSVPDVLKAGTDGAHGDLAKFAAWAIIGGLGAVALALVAEALGLLFGATRRAAASTTATIGAIAAVVLLVFVNIYSFSHSSRYDCTRDQRFTLPAELAGELQRLRTGTPTTIVVLQMHNFGTLSPKRDSYTKAAEEKVTEKVRDLVDQFRQFGPQFNVAVLDSEAFGYEAELKKLTQDAPELKSAIDAAPENSIFFYANKRVQRLSFNEFMQLDKTASKQNPGGENLVLLPQGIDTFARRVLTVQERRPKVAVCVVHELLTTNADAPKNRFALAGLRKSLTAQGYDVVDIVLKKGWANARALTDLKPAADTREESALERLEWELESADAASVSARAEVAQFEAIHGLIEKIKGRPWEERKAFYQRFVRGTVTEDNESSLLAYLAKRLKRAQDELEEAGKKKQEAEKRLAEAMKDERPLQDRRVTDVAAKFTKQLADVDLLIVPRYTTEDAMEGPGIEAGLHALSKEQAKVVKEFMKQGKPVLACLGPITPQVPPAPGESTEEFDKRLALELTGASDDFEKMLAERGIELGRTVVLFDGEPRAITRGGQLGSSASKVPPVRLTDPSTNPALRANPVASAALLTGRTAEEALDIELRAVRPVALASEWQARQPFAAEFAFTAADSWNTFQPFPRIDRSGRPSWMPKYTPTGIDDPKKGTRDEERRGPFPIAVAVESKIPAAWVDEDYGRQEAAAALLSPLDGIFATGLSLAADKLERPTQRTVVFGSGTLFNALKLAPPEEKLLLHTVNWLTAREDRLPKSDLPAWQYPRVELDDRTKNLWQLGTGIGLPLAAAYMGLLAMMRRRMR